MSHLLLIYDYAKNFTSNKKTLSEIKKILAENPKLEILKLFKKLRGLLPDDDLFKIYHEIYRFSPDYKKRVDEFYEVFQRK